MSKIDDHVIKELAIEYVKVETIANGGIPEEAIKMYDYYYQKLQRAAMNYSTE